MLFKESVIYTPTNQERTLHVYLPEGYDNSDKRYPVMYFFDGHNLFRDEDATFGRSWRMQSFLWQWEKELIIVGIECGHEGDERLSEYQPYAHRTGQFAKLSPLGDETIRWIIDTVKPTVDANLRTLPDRENTGIGGSSMGGLMALYAVTKYNEVFSKAACVSTALNSCIAKLRKDVDAAEIAEGTRVFFSWGTLETEGVKDTEAEDKSSTTYKNHKSIANKLEKKGAATELFCQVGGRHNEEDWEKQTELFMPFLWEA